MKIAVFGPAPTGGHPAYIAKLASSLASEPDVSVVWPRREDLVPEHLIEGVEQPVAIASMDLRPSSRGTSWRLSRLNPFTRHDCSFVRWLWGRRWRFDVVLLEDVQRFALPVLVLACRMKADKVVVHLHNVRRHDFAGRLSDRADERLTNLGLSLATMVVVHSEANRRSLTAGSNGSLDVRVVPHGVDPRVTEPRLPDKFGDVGMFGVLRKNKGLSVLTTAYRGIAEVAGDLVIAGPCTPTYRDEAQTVIESNADLPIRWENRFVKSSKLDEWFASISVLVLPYTQFEAQSGVLHQAIEHCVPVVVSNLAGLGETVREYKLGNVVQPNEPVELASAIEDLLDPEHNLSIRYNALSAQRGLEWRMVGQKFLTELRSM